MLSGKKIIPSALDEFNETIERLKKRAVTDMRGEGFELDDSGLTLELEITAPGRNFSETILSPGLLLKKDTDVLSVVREFQNGQGSSGY